ncbi:MAG: FMN-binding protein [Defluviitaleaceae bacterium]|nr:FMN-binding protein [Defluviitaleaceae bacterium]
MFLGVICTILFIVVCLRGLEKRKGKRGIFTKIHTPASILLVVATIAHIITTWQYLDARPVSIFATGFIAGFFILFATINGYLLGKAGNAKTQAKLHRIAALLAGIFIILHVAAIVVGVTAYQARVQNIVVTNIDVTHIPDGVYIGEYDVTYVAVRLAVTVESGQIANIEILEHRGGSQGIPAEAIIYTIQEQQNIDVDTITGATNSSRVIQAAIINALR